MDNYYVFNTFSWFLEDKIDFDDVLYAVKYFDKNDDTEQRKLILRMTYSVKFSQKINEYRESSDRRIVDWLEMYDIIKEWDDAWIMMIDQHPESFDFCPNKVAKNYGILTK